MFNSQSTTGYRYNNGVNWSGNTGFNSGGVNGVGNGSLRRVWITRAGKIPTTVFTNQSTIVDDLKTLILSKYPNSLGKHFDPSDLMIKLKIGNNNSNTGVYGGTGGGGGYNKMNANVNNEHLQAHPLSPQPVPVASSLLNDKNDNNNNYNNNNYNNNNSSSGNMFKFKQKAAFESNFAIAYSANPSPVSNAYILLEPDQNIWQVIDQYYPNGMTIDDCLIVDVPDNNVQGNNLSTPITSNFSAQTKINPASLNNSDPSSSNRKNFISNNIHKRSQSTPQSPLNSVVDNKNNNNGNQSSVLMMPKNFNSLSTNLEKSTSSIDYNELANFAGNGGGTGLNNKSQLKNTLPHIIEDQNKPSVDPTKANKHKNSSSTSSLMAHSPLKENSSSNSIKLAALSKKFKSTTEKVLPSINVLVVEDNSINQAILGAFLRKRKINYKIAKNGQEAIEKWKEGNFHLVLMDIQLPVKSGIEATIEIRRLEKLNNIGLFNNDSTLITGKNLNNTSTSSLVKLNLEDELDSSIFRTPVIIVALTASTSKIDRQKALAAGCNDFLTKPVNLVWLQNKIIEWGCMQALIDFDHWKD
ncbi:hypothetical protein PACTADRAFT_49884 [Pachysolen tannophilus NRRL Y-2460]|uniref:Response regulatory domain-containing protein n=1 Tax=Pachysolen tannophilus NRRL Y-2460 TaxID=669874 RepID=A0A1E4TTQ9_PACTA|nr:hypothetical protein PACTADRAFT_49884 [Pachysolen tannophilus NRRL Y-2460]